MKVGVVIFPGSNCDHDLMHALENVLGAQVMPLWHKDTSIQGAEAIFIPGGFSYGDYLRCGSIARFAPVMDEVAAFAKKGGPVLGICNGFQILTESHLLPGVLMPNASLKFICDQTLLKCETDRTPFTQKIAPGSQLQIPIAHRDGNFFMDAEGLKRLEGEGQVVFRYVNEAGEASAEANPNGSLNNIAGICSPGGNVVGMMPHPERVSEALLGSEAGKPLFLSLLG